MADGTGDSEPWNGEVALYDSARTVPEWMRQAARQHLGAEPTAIGTGHCPYLSQPGPLADVLTSLRTAVPPAAPI